MQAYTPTIKFGSTHSRFYCNYSLLKCILIWKLAVFVKCILSWKLAVKKIFMHKNNLSTIMLRRYHCITNRHYFVDFNLNELVSGQGNILFVDVVKLVHNSTQKVSLVLVNAAYLGICLL